MEPFSILPLGEMRRRLRGDEGDYTDREWIQAATIPLGPRGVVAIDPFYWKPRRDNGGARLRVKAPLAEVWLERWKGSDRRPRFAAVRIVLAKGTVRTRRRCARVPIDQGRIMVGCLAKLDAWWRLGGPDSKTNLAF